MSDWYDKTKTKIGRGALNLNAIPTTKMIAIKMGLYTFMQTHEFLQDVPLGARLGETTLTNVSFGTLAEAVFTSDDPVFAGLPDPFEVESFVVYKDLGGEGTSELIIFIDNGLGLPITTEAGRDLNVLVAAGGLAKL